MNKNFAVAAAESIVMHQLAGRGIRPVKQWDDCDVLDSCLQFDALSNVGLQTSEKNEAILDSLVSPVVFGAFHQDGAHPNIEKARQALGSIGVQLAELKWNAVSDHGICPLSGEVVVPSFGYWPFVGWKPVSTSVFDEGSRAIIQQIIAKHDWRDTTPTQDIAGYFVTQPVSACVTEN